MSSSNASTITTQAETSSISVIGVTTVSRSSRHASMTVITPSATITSNGETSSSLETITTTIITLRSGSPTTVTSVLVGPSGSLNNGTSGKRRLLPSGAIAAIAILSSLAVIAAALWLFFAYRRRQRRDLHHSIHYSVNGRGATGRSSMGGSSGMRSLTASVGLGAGAAYGYGTRGRSNSSVFPMRTSPLEGEDADLDAPHSASAHSGASHGPNSLEGGLMRETSVRLGIPIIPGWTTEASRNSVSDAPVERMRGGDASTEVTGITPIPEWRNSRERLHSLLEASGLGSASSTFGAPRQQRPSLSISPGTFTSPARTLFPVGPASPTQREHSSSSNSRTDGTRPFARNLSLDGMDNTPGLLTEDRRAAIMRNSSATAYQRRSLPPSAWLVMDSDKSKEKEAHPSSPSPVNDPATGTFGRMRSNSSMEFSSSGHGHGYGNPAITSSQGHGSATASGENEAGTSTGSGSSASHQGSIASRVRTKRRSNSADGGFFARAASLTPTSLRTRFRRASASSAMLLDGGLERRARPPSPVSRLVTSRPLTPAPAVGTILQPSSPDTARPPSRVQSMIVRLQPPGTLTMPPAAPSAMMRASGPGTGLPAILATPSPLPTPDGALTGLLDPRLAARLREIRRDQLSSSTVGLRDHEDYSRPIRALVHNRDSASSASSDYSQPSGLETSDERTPTQAEMRI
ncbi:uncharacterized protein FOMMEDRAFT_144981 [Fomitiporia mediterranea MF3/22]|uniref:uncharacterized protein n=1 Tax=Fomitiporia mediterranea (strain MF3/22) TaxID=694068 RepID=UPI000440802A|nr:uncharacterized protein FOMMEDRAFT_144981 [Fomitiporia mediterranea MF3/22]EJD05415.1 hypothetical protein FOMMEDRAFT_144981 [Fomitiporia mediterranea MF3/22]